jgi:hypothetical protein
MTTTHTITDAGLPPDDPEVVRVLEQYLAELEADRAPDRDALLAEHPDIADALADCLDGLDFLRKATHSESRSAWPTPDRRLGPYRLVRLIGRGGMGAVYEAEHATSQRRVAVKVLPFTAGFNDAELKRFKHEVRAAEALDHPHIVPLFEVGEDRGVHFFAMRLVAGRSLAEMIARPSLPGRSTKPNARTFDLTRENDDFPDVEAVERPTPIDPTFLAGRMLQAAEALGHAHAQGIVHRDVKPANLLLDEDDHLWVVDFGLAFVPGLTRLTASSALVGTLRYMAPEQVEPRRGVVDQRTDLYGLGATFYELLARRPVFPDADRAAVIARILTDDPTPLRRIDPSVPFDLETIVLKLLSKDPARRYPSMADLADDLRRFLAGKPILARRPGMVDRGFEWLNRHRRLAAAAAVTTVAFVGTLLWNESRVRHERDNAEAGWRGSDRTADFFFNKYVNTVLARAPHLEREHREFLIEARGHYERTADRPAVTDGDRLAAAVAARRVADIQARLGSTAEAVAGYGAAVTRLQNLPPTDAVRRELGIALNDRGNLSRGTGEYAAAGQDYRAAAEQFQSLVGNGSIDPFDRAALAGVENNQGLLWQLQDRRAEAEACFRAARGRLAKVAVEHPKEPQYVAELATASHNLAEVLAATGRDADAATAFRETAALREKVLAADPRDPAYRREKARTQLRSAEVLARLGRATDARTAAGNAVVAWRRLAADFPDTPGHRVGLTAALRALSMSLAIS